MQRSRPAPGLPWVPEPMRPGAALGADLRHWRNVVFKFLEERLVQIASIWQGEQVKGLGPVLRVTSMRQGCQVKRLGPVIVYRLHLFLHGRGRGSRVASMWQGDQIKTLGAVLRLTSKRQGCQVKRPGLVIVHRLHLWRRGGREGCSANQPPAPLVI